MGITLLFTKYYFLFFLTVIVFLSSGYLFYRLLPVRKSHTGNYTELFYSLFSGFVLFVTFFSIIRTGGRTVNILFIITGLILLYRYYDKSSIENKGLLKKTGQFLIKNLPLLFISTLIFYSYETVWLFKDGTFHFAIPFVDYVDMNNISQVITQTGQENNKYLVSNYYYETVHGISPYHYFELWLNGFLSSIFPISGMITLMLFVYPLFYVASYLGLLALWEHYGKVTFFKAALSLIILFTGGMYFGFYNHFELLKWYGGSVGNIAHVWGKKSAILYPFIIASFIHFVKNKNVSATILMLCTGIASIGVMPGISGGIFLFLLLNKWHHTYTKKELHFLYLLYFVFLTAFIGMYLLWGNKSEDSLGVSTIISDFFSAFDTSFLKKFFFRMFFSELRLIVIYSPYLLFVLYVLFRKKDIPMGKQRTLQNLLLLLLLILAIGSLTGAIASVKVFSGGQFFNYLTAILIVFILLLFVFEIHDFNWREIRSGKHLKLIFIVFFSFSSIYNIYNNTVLQSYYKKESLKLYSDSYLQSVTGYLDKHDKNPLGVCFMGNKDIEKYPLNCYGISLSFSGISVLFTNRFHAVSNLSIFDLNLDSASDFTKEYIKTVTFAQFINEQKNNNGFVSLEQSKLDFVRHFKIDYALVYNDGILPDVFAENIKEVYADSLSGQKFIIFNK